MQSCLSHQGLRYGARAPCGVRTQAFALLFDPTEGPENLEREGTIMTGNDKRQAPAPSKNPWAGSSAAPVGRLWRLATQLSKPWSCDLNCRGGRTWLSTCCLYPHKNRIDLTIKSIESSPIRGGGGRPAHGGSCGRGGGAKWEKFRGRESYLSGRVPGRTPLHRVAGLLNVAAAFQTCPFCQAMTPG